MHRDTEGLARVRVTDPPGWPVRQRFRRVRSRRPDRLAIKAVDGRDRAPAGHSGGHSF